MKQFSGVKLWMDTSRGSPGQTGHEENTFFERRDEYFLFGSVVDSIRSVHPLLVLIMPWTS